MAGRIGVSTLWLILVFLPHISSADDRGASGASVLLVTFERAGGDARPPVDPRWSVSHAVPGSNRPGRALFGLLSGIAPALVEGEVRRIPRDVLIPHRQVQRALTAKAWVANRERERVRTVRGFVPEITRYRRLRSVVRELEAAKEITGFYWVDVAEPMGARSANTVERLAGALGDHPTMVVATTIVPGQSGTTPLWIRDPGGSSGTNGNLGGSGAPFSLESVGTAMQSHLGLIPPPLAAGAWPRSEISLVERWEQDQLTLSARRGASMISVAWQPGRLATCWLRVAVPQECRWTRSRGLGDREVEIPRGDGMNGDLATDGDFHELQNHLLWVLERRLE